MRDRLVRIVRLHQGFCRFLKCSSIKAEGSAIKLLRLSFLAVAAGVVALMQDLHPQAVELAGFCKHPLLWRWVLFTQLQ
jgi:hypothetical protein